VARDEPRSVLLPVDPSADVCFFQLCNGLVLFPVAVEPPGGARTLGAFSFAAVDADRFWQS